MAIIKFFRTIQPKAAYFCYFTVHVALKSYFEELRKLQQDPWIDVGGNKIQLNFKLGGDMKFLLTVLGLQSALSTYACLYCKASVEERINPNVDEDYFWNDKFRRTLSDMISQGGTGTAKFGQIWQPLISLDPAEAVVVDELHMTMRVTERLLNSLFEGAVHLDGLTNATSQSNGLCFRYLLKDVRSVLPTFNCWISENKINFSSLWGGDQALLLENLPKHFNNACYIPEAIRAEVFELWCLLKELRSTFSAKHPTDFQLNNYFVTAIKFERKFLHIGDMTTSPGYQPKDFTAYMHVMVCNE